MKLCFVSLLAYPYFNASSRELSGGAELQMYTMATALARFPDFRVSFITGDSGQDAVEEREGVTLYRLDKSPASFDSVAGARRVWRLARLLQAVDADVYLQRAWSSVVGEIALFCRARKRKLIYLAAHDDDFLGWRRPDWLPRGFKAALQWNIFTLGLRMTDLIVAQHDSQLLQCRRIRGARCITRPSAHRQWPVEGEEGPRKDILWVARCERWKGPERFLEMARRLPHCSFVMVCPSSTDRLYFDGVRKAAAEVENLTFVDFVPFREMARYFHRARLFVNTSLSEGFPNTFVQAFQSGTPVVSLHVDPDGIFKVHRLGWSAAGDFDGMCRTAADLMGGDPRWEAMAGAARRYFMERHHIDRISEDDRAAILDLVSVPKMGVE